MSGNDDQIAYWNAEVGQRWAAQQARLDALIAPFGAAAMDAARVQSGERVIDVGCGCGDTTLALADAVGPEGHVLGVDVSAPMLARARERAGGRANVALLEADASAGALPGGAGLLYSRFGVMFFVDPTRAFAAMRAALRPGGRVAFVCWRSVTDNPWMMVPMVAGIRALGVAPAPPAPDAPGPFAFADEARVRAILDGAGYARVSITRFDAAMTLGADPMTAATMAVEVGPLGGLVRENGGVASQALLDAVADSLSPHAGADGVKLAGSTWIVTAAAP